MSELSGRAANGGARTGGPIPVSSSSNASGIRPPTEIMRARNAREQRKQEDQKAEEQRRLLEERRRRESAERRAAAMQGTAAPRNSQTSSQYTPESQQQPFDIRRSGTGQVADSQALGDPTGRTTQEYSSSRTRGPSLSQQDQPRPAPASSSTTRRPAQTQQVPRPATSSAAPAATSSQQPQGESSTSRGEAPAFPHAFHRWENLSAHWEGLTSFWLRRLEENTEKIRETVPNITTLNRQITDLSAAGANLFHAVVELQRLRASSERKFQRWFFDTRGDQEKNKEIHGQLENQLRLERNAREEATRHRAEALMAAENAKREAAETRRELMISKDEARRAWEELGRRNQESLETAQSLKDGRITLVHGVQVVPYIGGPSRSGSASQRPMTRDGQPYYGSTGLGGGGYASPGDEAEYYYQQEGSPTNTDPFMETGPSSQQQYQDQSGQYQTPLHQVYEDPAKQFQTPSNVSTEHYSTTAAPPTTIQRNNPVTSPEAQRFYQHGPQETFLHGVSQPSSQGALAPSATFGSPRPQRQDVQSEASYVSSNNEGEPEYATDGSGNILYDTEGSPIVIRRRARTLETDDDYDTEADVRREQELSAQYGTGTMPEVPSAPTTSSQAMYPPTSTSAGAQSLRPDYEGSGYGSEALYDTLQTRHHHPTRLSDVPEEEEERSSRRT